MPNWVQELRQKLNDILSNEEQKIESNPPSGKYKAKNIYVDPETGKTVIEIDNKEVHMQ
jgi:hypothetical protein